MRCSRPLPTFPAHGWVAAGAAAVLTDHVMEYELVDGTGRDAAPDGAKELALTILRSTGTISRTLHPWRAEPAAQAMSKAEAMVTAYVWAGFSKIHLDASMGCAGEPAALDDETIATRAARLAKAAEKAARATGGCPCSGSRSRSRAVAPRW